MLANTQFNRFFSTDYIFEKTPPFTLDYLYVVGIFVLLIVIAFIGWFVFKAKNRKLPLYQPIQSQFFNLFFYTGLIGLILSFFRWQRLAYLGSRFFVLVLFFVFILFGLSILVYRLKVFPQELKKYQAKKNFNKYLPR